MKCYKIKFYPPESALRAFSHKTSPYMLRLRQRALKPPFFALLLFLISLLGGCEGKLEHPHIELILKENLKEYYEEDNYYDFNDDDNVSWEVTFPSE